MKAGILAIGVLGCAISLTGAIPGLPDAGEPGVMKFADPAEQTLSNGLRVVVVHRPSLPIITASMLLQSGSEGDPSSHEGLTRFAATLLTRGSTTRTAPQIARELESLGATIESDADWDGSFLKLETLATNVEPAMRILADVLLNPAFAPEEIERLRKERIDEVELSLEQPGNLARAAALRSILGTSPYAHLNLGTPESLKRIDRNAISRRHAALAVPDRATLILAGDIEPARAFALAEKVLGTWKKGQEKPNKADAVTIRMEKSIVLIDVPDAGQAAVYVGRSVPSRSAETYAISQVTNAVLGGGYSARLNREVRIKRGLSYGCGSRITPWREAGVFGAATQTKNASAAEVVRVILGEIVRLAKEPIGADELTARKLVLTGRIQRELQRNEGYVKRISDFVMHGEPPGSFNSLIERINGVTGVQVQEYAASQLTPDQMNVVVVGRAQECEKSLREAFPKLRVIPRAKLSLQSPDLATEADLR